MLVLFELLGTETLRTSWIANPPAEAWVANPPTEAWIANPPAETLGCQPTRLSVSVGDGDKPLAHGTSNSCARATHTLLIDLYSARVPERSSSSDCPKCRKRHRPDNDHRTDWTQALLCCAVRATTYEWRGHIGRLRAKDAGKRWARLTSSKATRRFYHFLRSQSTFALFLLQHFDH